MLIVQDLLSALAKRLESGPLYLSREQLCRIQVDDLELDIEWLKDDNSVFVYIPVGSLLHRDNANLWRELMEANLFFQGTTDNALFGFDKEQGKVILFQRFGLENMVETRFVSACVAMIELAKLWQPKLMSATQCAPEVMSISQHLFEFKHV